MPAEIERLGGVARRGIVGIDGGGELPHGGVVFAGGQRRGAVLQSGVLGAGRADRGRTEASAAAKTARARKTAPAESKTARPEGLPIIRHVLAQTKKSGKSEALVYSTVTDFARFRG